MAEIIEEVDYEGLSTDSLAINMLAGSLAGISEHAVMFPVDMIKVRPRVRPAARSTG
jgi:solute carrier family 25 iron transporter 28/37